MILKRLALTIYLVVFSISAYADARIDIELEMEEIIFDDVSEEEPDLISKEFTNQDVLDALMERIEELENLIALKCEA